MQNRKHIENRLYTISFETRQQSSGDEAQLEESWTRIKMLQNLGSTFDALARPISSGSLPVEMPSLTKDIQTKPLC